MTTLAPALAFHFPNQKTIVNFLSNHNIIKDVPLIDERIIGSVAQYFADQTKDSFGVQKSVTLCLYILNTDHKLSLPSVVAIERALVPALKECTEKQCFTSLQDDLESKKSSSIDINQKFKELIVIDALKRLKKDNKIAFGELVEMCRKPIEMNVTLRDYLQEEGYNNFLESSGNVRNDIKKIIAGCVTGEPGNVTIVDPSLKRTVTAVENLKLESNEVVAGPIIPSLPDLNEITEKWRKINNGSNANSTVKKTDFIKA